MTTSPMDNFLVRLRIREAAERYFFCLDTDDVAGLARCFTENGVFRSATQAEMRLQGRAAIKDAFQSYLKWGRRRHTISSMKIIVDADTATSELLGASYLAGQAREGDPIRVRGLQYSDRWVLEDGEWLLADRAHAAVWQYEATQMHLGMPEVKD